MILSFLRSIAAVALIGLGIYVTGVLVGWVWFIFRAGMCAVSYCA